MPPRDHTKIQLDFPELVADMIEQLSLVGTVGLLDFAPTVLPVFIIGDRDLSVEANAPVFTSPEVFNGFAAAPAVNAIVVDTGQLVAGQFDLFAAISVMGTGLGGGHLELQHRNAANDATLAVLLDQPFNAIQNTSNIVLAPMGYTLAENERLRVQILLFGHTGAISGVIGARVRTVP